MKYNGIPPIGVLSAFKEGKLSAAESRWVQQSIECNPMVAAVVEDLNPADISSITQITQRIHERVIWPRIKPVGFWTRYAGWIGLSTIVLIVGFLGVLELVKPEPRYYNDTFKLTENIVDVEANVDLETRQVKAPQQEIVTTTVNTNTEDQTKALENNFSNVAPKQENLADPKRAADDKIIKDSEKSSSEITVGNELPDNTRSFGVQKQSNQTILLSLNNVQILSKTNPDALTTRSTGGKGNPLGEQTTSSSRSFSVHDVPAYPGGDRALQNYFRGKLRPIEIPNNQADFDRSVLVELTINSRGKLKDYEVRGQLHPLHQKALVEAIEQLPKFSKGSEKITYAIGLSF